LFAPEVQQKLGKIAKDFLSDIKKLKKIVACIENECENHEDLRKKAGIKKIVTSKNGYKLEFGKQHRALLTIEDDEIKIREVFYETKASDYSRILNTLFKQDVFYPKK
ncbi:hypothetical protein COT40_01295, partial [Candidatus Peregrinibacteria bacterium CG08_land_8_20_14_0_20_41_10]